MCVIYEKLIFSFFLHFNRPLKKVLCQKNLPWRKLNNVIFSLVKMFQIGSHQFMQYYASILHFSVNRSIKTRKKVPRRQYDWKMKKLPSMLRFFKKGNLRSISRFMDQTDVCFNGESVSYWWYHQFLVRLAAFCFFLKLSSFHGLLASASISYDSKKAWSRQNSKTTCLLKFFMY